MHTTVKSGGSKYLPLNVSESKTIKADKRCLKRSDGKNDFFKFSATIFFPVTSLFVNISYVHSLLFSNIGLEPNPTNCSDSYYL